jgi:hypothetical protein
VAAANMLFGGHFRFGGATPATYAATATGYLR